MNYLFLNNLWYDELNMRTHKENPKPASQKKTGPDLELSPCTSKSPRHRLLELLWSFGERLPAFQRKSESLMIQKGLVSSTLAHFDFSF